MQQRKGEAVQKVVNDGGANGPTYRDANGRLIPS